MLLKSTYCMRHSNTSICWQAAAVKTGVNKLEASAARSASLENKKLHYAGELLYWSGPSTTQSLSHWHGTQLTDHLHSK